MFNGKAIIKFQVLFLNINEPLWNKRESNRIWDMLVVYLTNWVRFLSKLVEIILVIHQREESLWKALWKIDLTRLSMSNIHALPNENCSSYLNFLIFHKHGCWWRLYDEVDDNDDKKVYIARWWITYFSV